MLSQCNCHTHNPSSLSIPLTSIWGPHVIHTILPSLTTTEERTQQRYIVLSILFSIPFILNKILLRNITILYYVQREHTT